jgi:Flp pilus assembly protein TadD
MPPREPHGFVWPAAAVFATALVVRLVHVWQMRETPFFSVLMGDSRGYDAWAREIAGGAWLGDAVFYQAPLYPYFLGVLYSLFGRDLLAVRLVQALAGALASVSIACAGRWLASPAVGVIAGLMLALYPPAIFFDGLIQKSVLDVLLIGAALALIASLIARDEATIASGRWWLLGTTMGALSLTRENALVLVAVLVVWALRARPTARTVRGSRPQTIARPSVRFHPALSFVAGLALILLPVAARNYVVGGGLYLTTSQFGSNVYIGNNPRSDGSYMSLRAGRGSPEFERLDATTLAEEAQGRRLTPAEVSSYWTERTRAFIAGDPGGWLRLLAWKSWLIVRATEIIDTEAQESHEDYSVLLRWLARVWHFGTLFPLAVVGSWRLWPDRRRLWPLYALIAAYAASVIAFYVVARYRLPLVPLLAVFAAAGVVWLVTVLQRRDTRGLAVALAAMALSSVAANWPLHTADARRAITENNLGTALQEDDRAADAIARYERALALDPGYTPALNNLGTALRATGRFADAIAAYDRALALGADAATVHLNRGNALVAGGRLPEAVAAFRQAVAASSASAEATSALANALYDSGSAALETKSFGPATDALREAVALRPDRPEAHNNLGIALASQGRLDEAMDHWRAALMIKPDFADARRNLEFAQRIRK